MIKISDIPIWIYFLFMMVFYAAAGDSKIWSGLYFCFNSYAFILLFKAQKNHVIKKIGISLNISIFLFCFAKYFLGIDKERYYTLFLFILVLIGLIYLQKHKK